MFDTTTWEKIAGLETSYGESGMFYEWGISSDSKWLIFSYCGNEANFGCASQRNVLEIFNLQDLSPQSEPILRLEDMPTDYWGVFNLIPYADGSFILTVFNYEASEDGSAIMPFTTFWHVQANGDYEELLRIKRGGVTMSPDGTYFLAGRNGQVELWGVPASITRGD
jgi:WD40 repeat protein